MNWALPITCLLLQKTTHGRCTAAQDIFHILNLEVQGVNSCMLAQLQWWETGTNWVQRLMIGASVVLA